MITTCSEKKVKGSSSELPTQENQQRNPISMVSSYGNSLYPQNINGDARDEIILRDLGHEEHISDFSNLEYPIFELERLCPSLLMPEYDMSLLIEADQAMKQGHAEEKIMPKYTVFEQQSIALHENKNFNKSVNQIFLKFAGNRQIEGQDISPRCKAYLKGRLKKEKDRKKNIIDSTARKNCNSTRKDTSRIFGVDDDSQASKMKSHIFRKIANLIFRQQTLKFLASNSQIKIIAKKQYLMRLKLQTHRSRNPELMFRTQFPKVND